jgi:hypothetical protein
MNILGRNEGGKKKGDGGVWLYIRKFGSRIEIGCPPLISGGYYGFFQNMREGGGGGRKMTQNHLSPQRRRERVLLIPRKEERHELGANATTIGANRQTSDEVEEDYSQGPMGLFDLVVAVLVFCCIVVIGI